MLAKGRKWPIEVKGGVKMPFGAQNVSLERKTDIFGRK
jgi:hypothetical protein